MWEDSFKDIGLPASSFEKFKFEDGYSKVYTEASPMAEDEKSPITGGMFKKINWLKVRLVFIRQRTCSLKSY